MDCRSNFQKKLVALDGDHIICNAKVSEYGQEIPQLPRHHEEKPHNTNSHMTLGRRLKQSALSS